MDNKTRLLNLAYEWYVSSYLLTKHQQRIGRRFMLEAVSCVHYEYDWEGEQQVVDNFFVFGAEPEKVVESIRAYGPASKHQLYVVAHRPGLAVSYMSLGCSAMTGPNMLMARGFEAIPAPDPAVPIYQAQTPGETMFLNTIDGADLTMAEDVADPRLAHYYANAGDRPVSMARVARLHPGAGWVSHIYTAPDYRRRGLATAVMARVLADQDQAGDRLSLLLATENAHSLYRKMGYLNLAPVLNFVLN